MSETKAEWLEHYDWSNDKIYLRPLKPCPFCGSKKVELKINKRLSACKVVCRNCGSKGTRIVRGITDENEEHMKLLAIGSWNMRANESHCPNCGQALDWRAAEREDKNNE